MSKKIFVATYPFGQYDKRPIEILENTGWEIDYNFLGRRLRKLEKNNIIGNVDGIIAGTEPYTEELIMSISNLKVISRVGVGLDNIDFEACRKKNIIVTYTPEAPSDSVADLTIAQIINLLRKINISNASIRDGKWDRIIGKTVREVKIGVLGMGRIGKRVVKRLFPFDACICVCDTKPDIEYGEKFNVKWMDKKELFKNCDIVTIHIPMNKDNYHCVDFEELSYMKEGSCIVNTSRGPIVNEKAIISMLYNKHLSGVALDVFEEEPYRGPLTLFKEVILTAHIAASTISGRRDMEMGAAVDCVRVLSGKKPLRPVAEEDK